MDAKTDRQASAALGLLEALRRRAYLRAVGRHLRTMEARSGVVAFISGAVTASALWFGQSVTLRMAPVLHGVPVWVLWGLYGCLLVTVVALMGAFWRLALPTALRRAASERAHLETVNTEVLRKLRSVMAAAPIGIAFTRSRQFELVSTEFCRLLGSSESAVLGRSTRMIYTSDGDYQQLGADVRRAFESGQPYVGEWRLARADGAQFWARVRGRPVDPEDEAAGAIWTMNNIDEQIAVRSQLEWSATHDPLTGIANRAAFHVRLERVFGAFPRSVPAVVLLVDLDHFKPINDSEGHAAGDAMLQAVAVALTNQVRSGDLVARLGGDEFAVLLERCPADVARRVAHQVRDAICDIRVTWNQRELQVGASVGVASLEARFGSSDAWLHAADTACYEAKALGRGAVHIAAGESSTERIPAAGSRHGALPPAQRQP